MKIHYLTTSGLYLILLSLSSLLNAQSIRITFGSCSDEDLAQPLWPSVVSEQPDLWIWMGDNIYGDTRDMSVLKAKYQKQKSHPDYQKLLQTCPVIGTWDDHDLGENDGGKNYPMRAESQQELLDFLDVSRDDPRRNRPGVYSSYLVEKENTRIKVLLLDTRYFRDDLIKENGVNKPNESGVILGPAQWTWLESELTDSDADIHLIVSSIQVIPEEHDFEKWANFPLERNKLLNLIVTSKVKNPLILSGDRHVGEISKISWKNKTLYDVTSSSLTHGWKTHSPEENRYRINELVYDLNYGLIEIMKDSIQVTIKGIGQQALSTVVLPLE